MENKQKAIEKAYGEHWEAVKDYVDENGWMPSSSWNFNLIYEQGKSFHNEKISDLDFYIRPLSLQGIETNNGWIKIESEADLPKEMGDYLVIMPDGDIRATFITSKPQKVGFTHYQPIIKPNPPIY